MLLLSWDEWTHMGSLTSQIAELWIGRFCPSEQNRDICKTSDVLGHANKHLSDPTKMPNHWGEFNFWLLSEFPFWSFVLEQICLEWKDLLRASFFHSFLEQEIYLSNILEIPEEFPWLPSFVGDCWPLLPILAFWFVGRGGISLNGILYPLFTIARAHSSFHANLGQSGPTVLLPEPAIEDRAMEVEHQNFFWRRFLCCRSCFGFEFLVFSLNRQFHLLLWISLCAVLLWRRTCFIREKRL